MACGYRHCESCTITRCFDHNDSAICDNCNLVRCSKCLVTCNCGKTFKFKKYLKRHIRNNKKMTSKYIYKRRCLENVTMAFVKKKRTEWSTFNEKVKRRELAKIIEGCLVKRKSQNSMVVCKNIY